MIVAGFVDGYDDKRRSEWHHTKINVCFVVEMKSGKVFEQFFFLILHVIFIIDILEVFPVGQREQKKKRE